MQYRKLGRTQLQVSEIGFGAWGIGGIMWQGGDDGESVRALHAAIDLGLNFIDTALAYGDGHSERLCGQVLRERSETIYLATKVPPKNQIWPARGTLDQVFPADYIESCVETSLRNLRMETIDLVQLHVWDPSWLAREDWYAAMVRLREAGKLRFFGISINDHEPDSALEVVAAGKIDTVQVIYNIFDQSPEDRLFAVCTRADVGVIARVPFDEGSLTGKITPETVFPHGDWRNGYFAGDRKRQVWERVQPLRALLGPDLPSLPDLALRFCLHHPAVSTVIPGMRTVRHARENLLASDRPALPAATLAELKKHRWVRNFYPED